MGLFNKIFSGLKKTKDNLSQKLSMIFGSGELTDEFYEDLEYVLISADIGVETVQEIIDNVKSICKKGKIKTQDEFREVLKQAILQILYNVEEENQDYPQAIMLLGVNGVGKTTAIGKLANYFQSNGKKVVMAAGDTFRAAAADQLTEWANRNKCRIVKQTEGADSASVVFDAVSSIKAKKEDVLLIDTAGRLHNKVNLMEELKKISKVVLREWPECNYKKYIVLDATTGQNAIPQVEYFNEAVGLDGIILTKLDGTAKGGVVIEIVNKLHIPVSFVGVGEGIDDLLSFNAKDFVDAII
ncbi:MAG: signal recognition particle-docking protein FtsY [Clostridiales bacterium]|nr:signal recognition particle-docking protein FtsY [Candidatus Apopatousia equi]